MDVELIDHAAAGGHVAVVPGGHVAVAPPPSSPAKTVPFLAPMTVLTSTILRCDDMLSSKNQRKKHGGGGSGTRAVSGDKVDIEEEEPTVIAVDITRDGTVRLTVTPCELTTSTPTAVLTLLREAHAHSPDHLPHPSHQCNLPVTVDTKCPWSLRGDDGAVLSATAQFHAIVDPANNSCVWIHRGRKRVGPSRSAVTVHMRLAPGVHDGQATVEQTALLLGVLHHQMQSRGGQVSTRLTLHDSDTSMDAHHPGIVVLDLASDQPPTLLHLFEHTAWSTYSDDESPRFDLWAHQSSTAPLLAATDGVSCVHVAIATLGVAGLRQHDGRRGSFRLTMCRGVAPLAIGPVVTITELADMFAGTAEVMGPDDVDDDSLVAFPVPLLIDVDVTPATTELLEERICLIFPQGARVLDISACVTVAASPDTQTAVPPSAVIDIQRCVTKIVAADATITSLVESTFLVTKHAAGDEGRLQRALLGTMGDPATPEAAAAALMSIFAPVNHGVTHEIYHPPSPP